MMLRHTAWVLLALAATSLPAADSAETKTAKSTDTSWIAELEKGDPGRWLYSGIIHQRKNELNDAVLDLENASRSSRRANGWWSELNPHADFDVRAADLASLYQDVGFGNTVARWTAARSVNVAPYSDFAPHLLMANTYSPLRDPRRIDQRVDTLWNTEYLVANLLAPVDAGTFGPYFAQPEMLRLEGRPVVSVSSETEYWSRGGWRETGTIDGRSDKLSYLVEGDYISDPGYRPNNDFEQRMISAKLRIRVTDADSVYFQVSELRSDSGDPLQYYNPNSAQMNERITEEQQPNVVLGYHHEWSERSHTLVLGGRTQDKTTINNSTAPVFLIQKTNGFIFRGPIGLVDFVSPLPVASLSYEREFVDYFVEAQQVIESEKHSTEVGARLQIGKITTHSVFGPSTASFLANTNSTSSSPASSSAFSGSSDDTYERYAAYAYHQWRISDKWLLSGGLTLEHVQTPEAFLNPPVASGHESKTKFSPKGGASWTPTDNITLRAAYSQGIGSVLNDQDFRLEPAQILGFNQSLRDVIPQSITDGPLAGSTFDAWQVSYEQRICPRTFFGVLGEVYTGDIWRHDGAFDVTNPGPSPSAAVHEHITFSERDITLSLDQLLGDFVAAGVWYRIVDADQVRDRGFAARYTDIGSTLHQIDPHVVFYHPCGFFSEVDGLWSQQSNRAYFVNPPGITFWQVNAYAGYRFAHRRAEIKVGVMDINDRNYKIAPLDLARETPRSRTFIASLKFAF